MTDGPINKRTRATNGKWSLEREPKARHVVATAKEKNPIYLDREPCWRCGASDRKLCGHQV